MTTISAIVPLHNKRPHIERALRSIANQTVPVSEVIVIDDASTDGGMEIVDKFAAAHPSIPLRTLRREEPGPGGYAARNLGIEQSSSEWIGFLDADDEWEPDFVKTVLAQVAHYGPGHGVVFGARIIVGHRPEPYVETAHGADPDAAVFDFDSFVTLWQSLGRCPVWTSATAMRRDDLMAAGLFPACRCRRGGDKDTWIRVIERTRAIAIPNVVATYHNDVVNQVTKKVPQNQSHCMIPTLEAMLDRHQGETRKTLEWLINNEITEYAIRSLGRAPLSREAFKGFRVGRARGRYAALTLVALSPRFVQNGLAQLRSWLAKNVVRRS